MAAIEANNPDLVGVLPRTYTKIADDTLVELLRTLNGLPDALEGDALGLIYEYFLGEFAMAEGQKGGEFFTPTSIVRLIVEIIQPFHGTIFDPACGSGGTNRACPCSCTLCLDIDKGNSAIDTCRTPSPRKRRIGRARPGALRPARTRVVGSGMARCRRAAGVPRGVRRAAIHTRGTRDGFGVGRTGCAGAAHRGGSGVRLKQASYPQKGGFSDRSRGHILRNHIR